MGSVKVEDIDHLGIVAGVIQDLGIIEIIDSRITPDEREEITTGEAIAGMIINGLGFSDRPMSLTPQFFEGKALDVFIREGIRPDMLNRFKLGRSLDDVFLYGCDLLFSEIALDICQKESIDMRFNSLDTTSISLTGDYDPDSDEHGVLVTYGYSKDKRPDLKQVVLELMVSQDGGVPFMSKSHDGNASDNQVFKQRCEGIIKEFAASASSGIPRYLVADSKLYTSENAANLAKLPFITRIPGNLNAVDEVIKQCLDMGNWQPLDEEKDGESPSYRYQRLDLCHYRIEQRWLVVYSESAYQRAGKTIAKAQAREQKKVNKQLFHLQAQRFESEVSAQKALDKITQKLSYHRLETVNLTQHIRYASRGKPKADSAIKGIEWQISGTVVSDDAKLAAKQHHEACFVVGTSIPDTELSDQEVIKGYKGQGAVERGFSFLKSPVFFVSSLFVKKPSRIEGLLPGLSSEAYRNHGDDPCIVGIFSSAAKDAESVSYVGRDDSKPD